MNHGLLSRIFCAGILIFMVVSCADQNDKADAYGNFEAREIIISSQSQGTIIKIDIEEGDQIAIGEVVAVIDTMQLHLQKEQSIGRKGVLRAKSLNVHAQIDVLEEQLAVLKREQRRTENLLVKEAATQKQLDDINGQINILKNKIKSTKTQFSSIQAELAVTESGIKQIEDAMDKNIIRNPVNGTVLEKYVEPFEVAVPGKALYKIADLDKMYLNIFISGTQLSNIKLGQNVTVQYDKNAEENFSREGTISWISSKAEFTPKIIQTKENRVNLVYAVKVKVDNDGSIKIGMPGEVLFNQ